MAWNRSSEGYFVKTLPKKARIGLKVSSIVILILLAVGAGLYMVFMQKSDDRFDTKRRGHSLIPSVKSSVRTNECQQTEKKTVVTNNVPLTDKDPGYFEARELVSTSTNGMYLVEMYRMPDGKMLKKYKYSVKPIWKTATDQLLHMALSTPQGEVMPPLPLSGEDLTREFIESLSTPIEIKADDSDEVQAAKQRIIDARETVSRLIKEGFTFEKILEDFQQRNNEDAELRGEVSDRIEEMKREGDIESARKYLKKANEKLREFGISEIRDRALQSEGEEQ